MEYALVAMKSHEDVESYLLRLGLPYERLTPEMWRVEANHNENLIISVAGPVVVFRVKVMNLPSRDREALYERLLRANTADMVHGSFGIEGDAVVLTSALALENLDYNEFQSVVDDLTIAVGRMYPELSRFHAAA